MLKINKDKSFKIPYVIEELFSDLHGAIDPDSGHIVCYKKETMVEVLEDDHGNSIPIITYDNRIALTMGSQNIINLLSLTKAKAVHKIEITVKHVGIESEDIRTSLKIEDIVNGIRLLKSAGYNQIKIYIGKITVNNEEHEIPILLGIGGEKENIALIILPHPHVEEEIIHTIT